MDSFAFQKLIVELPGYVPAFRTAFGADMTRWIGEGKIKWRETVEDGIESAPTAFLKLFKGENLGKMLVRLS